MKALLALVLTAILAMPVGAAMNNKKVAKKALQYSVLIRAKIEIKEKSGKVTKGKIGCSATYIRPTLILTAAHCVADPVPSKIWARDTEMDLGEEVTVVVMDRDADLALLRASKKHKYARLGKTPRVGDEVINIGSPIGLEFLASQGIVSSINYTFFNQVTTYFLTTAMVNHGSSGGGVFDRRGRLIGVNTMAPGGIFGWIGITAAVDVDTVKRFLQAEVK